MINPAVRGEDVRVGARREPRALGKEVTQGTHRACALESTWQRIEGLQRRAGITRVADITGLDTLGIPVALAIRPNAKTSVGATGKGLTPLQSRISAVMEALEIHHGETCDLPTITAPYADVVGAVDVWRLPRAAGMRANTRTCLQWCHSTDWVTGRERLLPYSLVHLHDRTGPDGLAASPFQRSTNGLASGNAPIEAVMAGMYEVIERDALALAAADPLWRHREDRLVDAAALDLPVVTGLLQTCLDADAGVLVYDLTSDLGIPVFAAHVFDRNPADLVNGIGFGAHLETEVALARAITEAAQGRTVSVAGSRDDHTRYEGRAQRVAARSSQRWLNLARKAHRVPVPREAHATFEEDFEHVVDLLAEAGFAEVLVTDLAREEFGYLPVVRVTVPGLEGIAMLPTYTAGDRARGLRT